MKHYTKFLLGIVLFGAHQSYSFCQEGSSLKIGRIEYEKRINAYDLLDDFGSTNSVNIEKLSLLKKEYEQFYLQYFTLDFNQTMTQYKLIDGKSKYPLNFLSSLNIISNYSLQRSFCEEEILGDKFYISDSVLKIKWRITDEKRTIKGFECRRANALVNDSIYVVAFYSLNIPVPGGPDIFNGLPGMILQVAIPHKHISWVVKSISSNGMEPEMTSASMVPKKTVLTRTQYIDKLKYMSKNWGELANLAVFILTL